MDGYDFEGLTRFDKLFTGIAVEPPKSLDPHDRSGKEGIAADDTLDGDYGRLLDRVEKCAKGMASPKGADPFTVAGSVLHRVA